MRVSMLLALASLGAACTESHSPSPALTAPTENRLPVKVIRWVDQEHHVACYYVESWSTYGGGPALSCVKEAP